jgi:hypothetical protein
VISGRGSGCDWRCLIVDSAARTQRSLYDFLTCFDGGSFILGGTVLDRQDFIDFGLELVDGCEVISSLAAIHELQAEIDKVLPIQHGTAQDETTAIDNQTPPIASRTSPGNHLAGLILQRPTGSKLTASDLLRWR